MQKRTLARHGLRAGWAHPHGHGPFDPYLYADGGDGDDSGSSSGNGDDDTGVIDDGQDDDAGKDTKPRPKGPLGRKPRPRPCGDDRQAPEGAEDGERRVREGPHDRQEAGVRRGAQRDRPGVGKVLGLIKDDKDARLDPAALKAQVESATAAYKSTAIELAVYRGAAKAGVDPDAITDSRAFMASIQDLDPTGEGVPDRASTPTADPPCSSARSPSGRGARGPGTLSGAGPTPFTRRVRAGPAYADRTRSPRAHQAS